VANTFVKKELAMSKVSARPFPVNACNSSRSGRMQLDEARQIAARDGSAIDRGEQLSTDQMIALAQAWQVVRAKLTEAQLGEFLAFLRNTCESSL
jgi:hypothetical protein